MSRRPSYGATPRGWPLLTTFCNSWLKKVGWARGKVAAAGSLGCSLRWRIQGHDKGGLLPAASTNLYWTEYTVPVPSIAPSKMILVLETYAKPTAKAGFLAAACPPAL